MLKAVIFDLDGTILDNDKAYDTAFGEVLRQHGVDITHGFAHTGGVGVKSNWREFIKIYNLSPSLSLDDLERQTQESYINNINKIKIRDGFVSLAEEVRGSNLKSALATGNDLETTQKVLQHFQIGKFFDAISTIYEVSNPKPHPDIFLLASRRVGVVPQDCLVIEDSEAGLEAAKRAGMRLISIHEYPFTALSSKKLHYLFDSKYN